MSIKWETLFKSNMTKAKSNKSAVYDLLFSKVDFDDVKSVCLYCLGHPYFYRRLKKEHPDLDIQVVEDSYYAANYGNLEASLQIVNICGEEYLPTYMKHFDFIIMNPPYSGNLHLQILQKALKHADNVVNLSPVRWLQDPFKEYKKGSDFEKFAKLRGKVKDIELIDAVKARQLFDIQVVDLGVYTFDGKTYNKTFFEENSIINKVLDAIYKKHLTSIKDVSHKETKPEGNFNYVLEVYGGDMKTGSGWVKPLGYEMRSSSLAKHQNTSKETYIVCRQQTAEECVNFYNSTKTNFFCYLDKASRVDLRVFPQFYPYMGNVVNPRTGKKGYEGPWTDDDFYKFFNLTADEIKIVEETMKDYE